MMKISLELRSLTRHLLDLQTWSSGQDRVRQTWRETHEDVNTWANTSSWHRADCDVTVSFMTSELRYLNSVMKLLLADIRTSVTHLLRDVIGSNEDQSNTINVETLGGEGWDRSSYKCLQVKGLWINNLIYMRATVMLTDFISHHVINRSINQSVSQSINQWVSKSL